MSRFFDIADIRQKQQAVQSTDLKEPVNGNSKCLVAQFDELHFYKVSTLKLLTGKLPAENEIMFLETTNSFNAFTFIVYLLKFAGRIDDLMVKTYSINARILDSLSNRIRKGEIGETCLYIAESIKYRMPRVKDQVDMMLKEFGNFRVEYAWTHQKVICARVGEHHYVVEGSGNFSENSAEEQYIFLKSKQIYGFRVGNNA